MIWCANVLVIIILQTKVNWFTIKAWKELQNDQLFKKKNMYSRRKQDGVKSTIDSTQVDSSNPVNVMNSPNLHQLCAQLSAMDSVIMPPRTFKHCSWCF